MALLPDASDLVALAAAMNANAQASEEFGGFEITLEPGDLTPGTGGSLTDAAGAVYTLPYWSGPVFGGIPMGEVFVNGEPQEALGGGFVDAIRIVSGVAFFENAKGMGWANADVNVGNNIGSGDSGAPPVDVVAALDHPPSMNFINEPVSTDVTAITPLIPDDVAPQIADLVQNVQDVLAGILPDQDSHHFGHIANFDTQIAVNHCATGGDLWNG